MKKILITGVNSYIGSSFRKWVSKYPDRYTIETISLRDNHWKEKTFSGYDIIFHTAAIVHVKEKDPSKYYKINRDLTIELAQKAKKEGVKQFIFLSTMGIYGLETGLVTRDTVPSPKSHYAKSKYEAGKAIVKMGNSHFTVAIVRPPIVYGKGCPGNYAKLSNLARKLPVFPDIENVRSMIYIENLTEFIRLIIEYCRGGVFFPQDERFVCSTELVNMIAELHGKKIYRTKLFNPLIRILRLSILKKVFGNFVYDSELSKFDVSYNTCSFLESIRKTEVN